MELPDVVRSARVDLDPDEAYALWRALDRQAAAYDNSMPGTRDSDSHDGKNTLSTKTTKTTLSAKTTTKATKAAKAAKAAKTTKTTKSDATDTTDTTDTTDDTSMLFTCHMTTDELWAPKHDWDRPDYYLPSLECSAFGSSDTDEDGEWAWRAHKSGWVVHGDPVPDYACTCERFFAAHEEHGVVFGFGPEPEYLLYASSQEALEAFLEQDFIFWYDPQDM
jgi:hypothetical protein